MDKDFRFVEGLGLQLALIEITLLCFALLVLQMRL